MRQCRLDSRIDRMGFVVAYGREDRGVGEVLLDHLDRLANDVKVALASRVPDVVRNQVSCPQNQVQVLVNNVGRRVRDVIMLRLAPLESAV